MIKLIFKMQRKSKRKNINKKSKRKFFKKWNIKSLQMIIKKMMVVIVILCDKNINNLKITKIYRFVFKNIKI